jgi:adenylosuccinate lyase
MPAVARQTAATQWLERTLDDSAARRIVLPEAFLAADAILSLYLNIVPGLVVNPEVIARKVELELPFMATENLMMAAVELGADRQEVHERVRQHSLEVAAQMKREGPDRSGALIERLKAEPAFARVQFDALLDPKRYIGRCPEQVESFVADQVEPIRRRYPGLLAQRRELHV